MRQEIFHLNLVDMFTGIGTDIHIHINENHDDFN